MIHSKTRLLVLLTLSLLSKFSFGQSQETMRELALTFSDFEVLSLDSDELYQKASQESNLSNFALALPNGSTYVLDLQPTKIISDRFFTVEQIGLDKKNVTFGSDIKTFQGTVKNVSNSKVALTLNKGFIYGFIKIGFNEYFIEPLYHLSADRTVNKYVWYNAKDVIKKEAGTCGADQMRKIKDDMIESTDYNSRSVGECFELEYNYASDFSMFTKYGSTNGVNNFIVGVMNNVQTNYDNEFADELQYLLGEHFSSTCSSCDPWTNSTDPGVFLESFSDWAGGGFNSAHDLGGIWTNRDFQGTTIGIAWVNTLCENGFKYHALQDFPGGTAASLRVMTSHEIGHNFGCSHDPSGTWIMSPSVSSTNNWSPATVTLINNKLQSVNCLANCPASGSPVANFSYNIIQECVPAQVQYFDQSTNATSRSWSFPGGTPSSSTAANPIINYNSVGTFGATLTVNNTSGSNSITMNNIITSLAPAVSNFTQTINGNSVNFTFTGSGATETYWVFGDGNDSFETNPEHIYATGGTYTVICTASNACSSNVKTTVITLVIAPVASFTANNSAGCQPLNVSFTSTSLNNPSGYLWTFPGGNPGTSTLAAPTVAYNTAGSFDVTLRVTNSAGSNTVTQSSFVVVNPIPTADHTSTQNGPAVQFTNTSQNSNSVSWAFGDGATSTSNNPTHTYTSNGTFTVTQVATNACGTNTKTSTVTIAQAPVASFTSNAGSLLCSPQNVQFTSTSTYNPSTYAWEFEGGTPATSNVANPSVLYNTPGTFDVKLTVTNAFGQSESFQQDFLVVQTTPTISFSTIADGLTYNFNSSTTNGIFAGWNFGDGSPIDPNPITTHTFPSQGTYTVTAQSQNGCGTSTSTQVVNVVLLPTAAFSASSTNTCTNQQVQFTNLSSPSATSWLWTFEGGTPATSTLQNPTVSYTNAGSYDVSLVVTNIAGQGSTTLTDYITVGSAPTTGIQTSLAANVVNLTNTGTGATSTTWTITGPNGSTTLSGPTASFTAPENGSYSIIQVNTNACGSTTATSTVTMAAYVQASFTTPNLICEDAILTMTNTSTSSTSVVWNFEGGSPPTSTANNPSVNYANPGTYNIQLIASNALGDDTTNQTIVVGLAPQAGFTHVVSNNNVAFTSTANSNAVVWNFGDGSTSTDINPSHNYSVSGTYNVSQIVTNGCGNDTSTVQITVIVSSTNDQDQLKANLYPNPSKSMVYINLGEVDLSKQIGVSIINQDGRQVMKISLDALSTIQVNIEDLIAGEYIIQIQNGNKSSFKKLVKL